MRRTMRQAEARRQDRSPRKSHFRRRDAPLRCL